MRWLISFFKAIARIFRVEKATKLQAHIYLVHVPRRNIMKHLVALTWKKSVSAITKQHLTVKVGDVAVVDTDLDAVTEAHEFLVDGGVHVVCSLVESNAFADSDAAVLEFDTPALEKPAAATDLAVEFKAVQ